MFRNMHKSKIHRATLTEANLNYVGSITIDQELMRLADILENEKVQVVNINTGDRFETYAIPGNTGQICLNGAAARLGQVGDRLIIISYAWLDELEAKQLRPKVVMVDDFNRPLGCRLEQHSSTLLCENR